MISFKDAAWGLGLAILISIILVCGSTVQP